MRCQFIQQATHPWARPRRRALPKDGGFKVNDLPCAPGDDLGTFQFGSTVVLLVGGPKGKDWAPSRTEGVVKMGQRLGAFR